MRKIAVLLTAAFALLLVTTLGFQADATIGSGTQGLPIAAKTFSPLDRVSCRTRGPMCPLGYNAALPALALLVYALPLG